MPRVAFDDMGCGQARTQANVCLADIGELHACENDPTPANLARASQLREALAGEIAHWKLVEQRDADLSDFHELAKAGGTTLKEALTKYVAAEQRLRLDPAAELARIAETVGFDIDEWARGVLAECSGNDRSSNSQAVRGP